MSEAKGAARLDGNVELSVGVQAVPFNARALLLKTIPPSPNKIGLAFEIPVFIIGCGIRTR